MADELALAFVEDQRRKFREIRRRMQWAVKQLSDADVNWRPNAESNSVANLVAHVCGNLTQRYVAQLAGGADTRDREAEFSPDAHRTSADLQWMLDATFDAVDEVLSRVTPAQLLEPIVLRGRTEHVMHIIAQTSSHASEHLGQVIYIAKMRLGPAWQPAE